MLFPVINLHLIPMISVNLIQCQLLSLSSVNLSVFLCVQKLTEEWKILSIQIFNEFLLCFVLCSYRNSVAISFVKCELESPVCKIKPFAIID